MTRRCISRRLRGAIQEGEQCSALVLTSGQRMYKYNLIILHKPRAQGIGDFLAVQNIMVGRAPDIEVHILSPGSPPDPDFWRRAAARPTLIFSPSEIAIDPRIRGTKLVSRRLGKLEEMDRIRKAGLPFPETQSITRETKLDEAQWGPFAVVKPNHGVRGRGISLVRTRDVRWIDTSLLPKDDPCHGQQLLAQRYVDPGPFALCYRVMTVLGRPIYCMTSRATERRPPLVIDGGEAINLVVAANAMARRLKLVNEKDVVELATSLHKNEPDIPVMGTDIIREHGSGRLFLVEFNSRGRTWHLSSEHGQGHQRDFRLDYYGQFSALDSITNALIEVTRKRAS